MPGMSYWMISNRAAADGGATLGVREGGLRFYTKPDDGKPIDDRRNWNEVTAARFRNMLVAAADGFPLVSDDRHEDQKHVTLFIHGYNNSWEDAAIRYQRLVKRLYGGDDGLGVCVLFTWPSDGRATGYLPDRRDARESAEELAEVLSALYDWMLKKQTDALAADHRACRAKLSVIAHSMGNYVLQNAMQWTWTRKNRPLLVSLVNQLVMVAADVDNDLFRDGESIGASSAEGSANLSYRITALYSGRDSVLGMSAGLKHFGKRRLGRSGFDRKYPLPDNVWDVDCSSMFPLNEKNIHSAYFECPRTLELMRQVLRGLDRGVLLRRSNPPSASAVAAAREERAAPAAPVPALAGLMTRIY